MPAHFINFFNPKNIAVVGASNNINKVGGIVFNNILNSEFSGKVYPVNISEEFVLKNKSFKNVYDIDDDIDLVLVAIPAKQTLELLEDLGSRGYKNFILYASGFKELGSAGIENEKILIELINKYSLNVLGPNCFGFINNNLSLNTTFGKTASNNGKIKFISQSGAIASSIFDFSNKTGVGFSEFITIGNKSGLTEIEVLEYYLNVSENSNEDFSIGMYLESISNGSKFINLLTKLSKRHKIFVLKPGKSEASKTAMMSHTGSLAGEDYILESALSQSGVIRCESLQEFFDISMFLSWQKIPKNNKIVTISNAGGPSVISSDFASLNNLELEVFSKETSIKLSKVLPITASIKNPIDLVGDAKADRFENVCNILLKDSDSDFYLFVITPQVSTEIEKTTEIIVNFSKSKKNVSVAFIGGKSFDESINTLYKNKIPVFPFPENALQAVSKIINTKSILKSFEVENLSDLKNNKINKVLNESIKNNNFSLDAVSSIEMLKDIDFMTPDSYYLDSVSAKKIDYPIILKITSTEILHKKDIGGISEIINNKKELLEELKKLDKTILKLKKDGIKDINILVQEKVNSGIEVLLGLKKDSVFGNFLFFGIGGSFVEIVEDKNVLFFPLNKDYILENLKKSKLYKVILKENLNIDSLINEIMKFSKLINYMDEIKEIEINPLIFNNEGIWAVDPKIILNQNERDE